MKEAKKEKKLIGTATLDTKPKRLPENLVPVDADFLASKQYDEYKAKRKEDEKTEKDQLPGQMNIYDFLEEKA